MENYVLKILNELTQNAEKIEMEQILIFLEEIKKPNTFFSQALVGQVLQFKRLPID